MKKTLIIIHFFVYICTYSQSKKCTIPDLQYETYDFAIKNLKKISQNISNKNSLIEIHIEIENKVIKQIKYNLISPENNYSGENKSEIEVWKGVNSFITKNINHKLKNCPDFYYEGITYRMPLSKENIKRAIDEVNETVIQEKKNRGE